MTTASPVSPIAIVGTIALLLAFVAAAFAFAAGIAGNARKSRRLVNASVFGLYGFSGLVALASSLMIYAFVSHDFAIKYVAQTSDTTMPTAYKITAFWGGLDGSLLFWVLVLALFSTIAIATNHKKHRDMIGYVVATIMVVQVFFLSLLIFTKNPFNTYLTSVPTDGQGLNPLLQNYWMVIHPPSLYTGFVAATIPFAFGIGALASGRLDDLWLGSVRVWMLICFGFLSLGLILGGRWAYEELGWGGYWAWDPVECAGLIPWFTATAFLHSAIIQEQRGGMKIWNLALVVLTFFLTVFGTFMTRSGVVQSVHAFGQDNVLAVQFVVFLALILIVSIGLIVHRANKLASRTAFDSFYSREFAFLANNWILLACAFFVLFATMFPTITQSVNGGRVSVGIPFFNKWMTPFGLVLVFLAGAAPLLAWRKTTRSKLWSQFEFPLAAMAITMAAIAVIEVVADMQRGFSIGQIVGLSDLPANASLLGLVRLTSLFSDGLQLPVTLINFGLVAFLVASIGQELWRGTAVRRRQTGSDPLTSMIGLILSKRRKYGGYIVHLGIAVLFMGFAGKAYERMQDRTIEKPGQVAKTDSGPVGPSTWQFDGYTFTYEAIGHTSDEHKDAVTAQVGIYMGDERIGTVYPAKWDFHKGEGQMTTEVAIRVRLSEDVYVVLTGFDLDTKLANFRVYINPLILWVWVGFIIMAFGTLVCLIPQGVVDSLQWKPKTRLGRAADVSIVASIALIVTLGIASQARADAPAGTSNGAAAEHVPAGMGMGNVGAGYAAMNRPVNDTQARAMKEVLCPCGCARQSIFDCECETAADLRAKVVAMLAGANLSDEGQRAAAYQRVLDAFKAEYGEGVFATPKSSMPWLLPSLAAIGGLGLLYGVGRRFVSRGAAQAAPQPAAPASPADDEYADKLDDELADTE